MLIYYLSVIILTTASSISKAQEMRGQVYSTLANTDCAQKRSKEKDCIAMTVVVIQKVVKQ